MHLCAGRLAAVSVIDILPSCISSKYFFWDPGHRVGTVVDGLDSFIISRMYLGCSLTLKLDVDIGCLHWC